jgi:hypothetical protein
MQALGSANKHRQGICRHGVMQMDTERGYAGIDECK